MDGDGVRGLPPERRLSARVSVPVADGARFRTVFGRALRLRCPYCGGRGIFKSWFDLRETCPTCGTRFERENGYFLGGYALNLIVAEFLAVGAVVLFWLLARPSVLAVQVVGVALAAGLPILFFPFSRSLWMALDLQLHPPGRTISRGALGVGDTATLDATGVCLECVSAWGRRLIGDGRALMATGPMAWASLEGMTALVTGAGSGIGRASAVAMAAAGARVAVTELPAKMAAAEETVGLVEEAGGVATALPLDVLDVPSIEPCVRAAAGFGGDRLDILVNNAGLNVPKMAFEVTEADWDKVLDVNLKGVFFVAQAAGRVMRDQTPPGGAIVNMASQMGVVGYVKRAAYCSSKAGVVNLTRVLCFEWAEYGIRVNAIGPTFVETPLTRPMFEDQAFKEDVLRRIPLGRLATPEEVAAAVVYLASPGAAMVNGHTLLIDGGWTAV